jgi:hypothetical protein
MAEHLRTRYAIHRRDGLWFHNPTDWEIREWVPDIEDAHLWVDHGSCMAAAFIRGKLRLEDVTVTELAIDANGIRYPLISTTA